MRRAVAVYGREHQSRVVVAVKARLRFWKHSCGVREAGMTVIFVVVLGRQVHA